MKLIFSLTLLFIVPFCFAQHPDFQVWTETGVKTKLNKSFDLTFDWTNRVNNYGLKTSFPQASIRYKLNRWLKFSVDYRYIMSKQNNGYYSSGNRLNTNIQSNYVSGRASFGLRARYQYSFNRIIMSNYDPEFDVSLRFKPSFSYDIKNSLLSPYGSIEIFYTPQNGPLGNRITRLRYQIGVNFETKLPFDLSLGYLYDDKMNLPNVTDRHALTVSALYLMKKKKLKKKQSKSSRDL